MKESLNERQRELLAHLNNSRFLSIPELAVRLFASEATIRRDIRKLKDMNMVNVNHGNVSSSGPVEDIPLHIFQKTNLEAKKEIAEKAVKLIHEKDVLFLDATSTTSTILDYLGSFKSLTIFTNGLETAQKAADLGYESILIGGRIRAISHCCYGSLAEKMLSLVYFNTMFFSAPAISEDGELTHYSSDQILLIQSAIQRASASYFLCVSNKLGKKCTYHICNTSEITGIIHDDDPSVLFPNKFPL